MDNESAKSSQHVQNPTSNYSSESSSETVPGNQFSPAAEKIDAVGWQGGHLEDFLM